MSQPADNTQNQPKAKRTYRTATQWAKIVEEYESSDMTQEAFCKQRGIASSGLYQWRNKLNEQQKRSSVADIEKSALINMTPDMTQQSANWDVELQLTPETVLRFRLV